MRLPTPTAANVRRVTLANLIANIAIVITGAAVRLTGSGLGCAEWPTCNDGALVPTSAMPINTYIEFINRTFTFVLILIALLTWLVVRQLRPQRRDLTRLALLVGGGIILQGVIGGITVLTGLNPFTVIGHLLLSMVLIYWSTQLWVRGKDLSRLPQPYASKPVKALAVALMSATWLVLAIGTVVTGSGPHSGDPEAGRLSLDPVLISQLHADAVFLLVGLTLATTILVHIVPASATLRRAVYVLLAVEAAQATVGYVQYFNGLPIVVVGIHLLGASLTIMGSTMVSEELRYLQIGKQAAVRPLSVDPREELTTI